MYIDTAIPTCYTKTIEQSIAQQKRKETQIVKQMRNLMNNNDFYGGKSDGQICC